MQMYVNTTSKKAMFHIVSNSDFKSQVSFINNYLAYATSHGIGGGGGGGHGVSYYGNIRGHDTF
jgi:glycine cleavage system protein P-like pyridoxal-binding family